ncbi:MAG: hypothetical protein ACTSPD_15965 [Promethearchaeota archaeon]
MKLRKELIDDILMEIKKIENLFKSFALLIKEIKNKTPTFSN